MAQRIGFIGVGLMGHGMAENILEKGYGLVLAHATGRRSRTCSARREGRAQPFAGDNDVVIFCVPSSAEVELCVLAENGILAGAHDGLIVVDSTTARPASTERVAQALAARGVRFAISR